MVIVEPKEEPEKKKDDKKKKESPKKKAMKGPLGRLRSGASSGSWGLIQQPRKTRIS